MRLNRVTGAILWANLHLLFWLSLFPFATGWMGENHFATAPSALYGLVLLMAAIAYLILQQVIIASEGPDLLAQEGGGQRLEGKTLPLALRGCHCDHSLVGFGRARYLLSVSAGVACARSSHRERAPSKGDLDLSRTKSLSLRLSYSLRI